MLDTGDDNLITEMSTENMHLKEKEKIEIIVMNIKKIMIKKNE